MQNLKPETKRKSVLIVEDNESLLNILQEKLESLDIDVSRANTGIQALTLVSTSKPDLILLDIMLPGGMNGFDVLERLKKDTNLHSIPVIILTNLDSEQKTALTIGAVDYIVKANLSIEEVVLKVKNHLK